MQTIEKLEAITGYNTAVITGAASGIGRAFSKKLLSAGWTVCAVDYDAAALRDLSFSASLNGKLLLKTCDITNYDSLSIIIREFLSQCGAIGLLLNAAGIGASGLLEHLAHEDWQQVINTNLMGVVNATHSVLPHMKNQGFGHICSIASAAAYHSLPSLSAYNMSKAAVVSMTETLQAELANSPVSASVMISAFYKSNIANFTLGGAQAQTLAAGLVALSKMSAEDAAMHTFKGITKGQTHIVVGGQAKVLYRFKRFFPRAYGALAPRIAQKAFAKASQPPKPHTPPRA